MPFAEQIARQPWSLIREALGIQDEQSQLGLF